ncbi:Bola1, partial [Symbiodinium sp. KB8]
ARALQAELPASAVCLAPPPAPLEQCAVGALASGSSDSQVLVIDSLQGARQEIQVDAAPEQAEVSDGEAILQSDDEALLLGEVVDGTVRTRKRTDAGFDSDSGSE